MSKDINQINLSDNELQIIQEALKFQIHHFFEKEDMLHVERLYALKLGEIVDRLNLHLKSSSVKSAK